MKKVSVIVPNYNYEKFIGKRLDSIINQTYPVYELIILDDASTDNSVKIIEEKIKNIKNIKIKFIKNEKNSNSVFSQWQLGLKYVSGDYFWIAEADDVADENFLKEAIKYFDKDKDIKLFYSDSKKIDENDNVFSDTLKDYMDIFNTHKWDKDYINDGKDEIIEALSNNNTILNVSSVVWKYDKKFFDYFEDAKEFKIAGDWYIYYRALENGKIGYSNKALNYFRKHTSSVSSTINTNLEYKEVYRIQEEIREKYKLKDDIIQKQIQRRKFMGFCENEINRVKEGNIAFIFDKYNNKINFKKMNEILDVFISKGYKCDLYFKNSLEYTPVEIAKKLDTYADVFTDLILNKKYDVFVINSDFNGKASKNIYLTNNLITANKLKRKYKCNILKNNIEELTDLDFENIVYKL